VIGIDMPIIEEANLSFDAFFARYCERPTRYELHDGQLRLLIPEACTHSVLAGNAAVVLRHRAKPQGLLTFMTGMYFRTDSDDQSALLPDCSVSLPSTGNNYRNYATDPVVIVEVLSPSTMQFDRGAKLQRYFKFNSLQHVILLYQDEYRAEMWTRPPEDAVDTDVDGNLLWTQTVANGLNSSLKIDALGDTIGLDEFYDGVELAA
jgi:Uma2 family endonuclease